MLWVDIGSNLLSTTCTLTLSLAGYADPYPQSTKRRRMHSDNTSGRIEQQLSCSWWESRSLPYVAMSDMSTAKATTAENLEPHYTPTRGLTVLVLFLVGQLKGSLLIG